MNIHQGKEKLKEETLEQFVDSKRDKPVSVSYVTAKDGDSKAYDWAQKEAIVKAFTTDAEKRKWYNDTITDIDPLYAGLKPLDGYIVRLCVREYMESSTGLLVLAPDMAQSIRPGSHTPGEAIRNPYDFDSVAVVVAVPEFEKKLVPGDKVQVVRPRPEVVVDQVVHYENGYAHPDYKLGELPKDTSSRHFGYALIPYNRIKVLL